MAPSLVERTTVDNTAEITYKKNKDQENYKEAFSQSATTTNYDTEINGSDTIKPAKYPHYLPCEPSQHPLLWDIVLIDHIQTGMM